MIDFLLWYVLIFILGVIGFPITFRLLGKLKDRGYTLAKTLSLLVWGYLFWMLSSLGFIQNNLGGALFALVILICISVFCLRGKAEDIRKWVKSHIRILILSEIVFLVGFSFMAVIRAANPALIGTEKPMEMAFINAILKSPSFPPNDPWLSGYSISYYYFGYVIVSLLIRMTGTSSTIAFNLMIALIFGLVSINAFGLLNNLLQARKGTDNKQSTSITSWLKGLLAPLFILVIGNLEGFLEMLHANGAFWTQKTDGSLGSGFWTWLNMPEVENPPTLPFSLVPNRANGYWWWRASRVVQDFKINGERVEIIDEFPQFSFILSDLHPHVLAMPFVLLAVGVILNIFLGGTKSAEGKFGFIRWATNKFFKQNTEEIFFKDTYIYAWIIDPIFWLMALIAGGIAFFNTWDFPIYVGLLCLAIVLRQYQQSGWTKLRWIEFFETGIFTGIVGVILYLPYYIGFASQAGGFLPSINFFTRGVYFWIMFGGLLLPMIVWLIWKWQKNPSQFSGWFGGRVSIGMVAGFWIFSYLFAAFFIFASGLLYSDKVDGWLGLFFWLQGSSDGGEILIQSLLNRINAPFTWITLLLVLFLVWGLLAGREKADDNNGKNPNNRRIRIDGFVLLLILMGAGLTLVPEYIYLQDQFGTRMNTIFKFYYQSWILWSLAASFALVILWEETKGLGRLLIQIGSIGLIAMGLAYPTFAILNTTNNLQPQAYVDGEITADWSLDGALYRSRNNPDEWSAILWLKDAPLGVIAEAVGGSYTDYARVATYSGMQNVLGWPGHESQWRGGAAEMGTRESDIETLYRSGQWPQVQLILEQYDIRYVFMGSLEQVKYGATGNVFAAHLNPVFQSGETIIYEYDSID